MAAEAVGVEAEGSKGVVHPNRIEPLKLLSYAILGFAPGLFWLWFFRRKDDLVPDTGHGEVRRRHQLPRQVPPSHRQRSSRRRTRAGGREASPKICQEGYA